MKEALSHLLLLAGLALFAGVGLFAWQVGQSWSHSDTQTLIGGMIAACSGGFVVLALIVGLVVGVPLALRAYSQGAESRRRWDDWEGPGPRSLPGPAQSAPWLSSPPQITQQPGEGRWLSAGPAQYDLLEADPDVSESEWVNLPRQ
jgi:hypothetical protein